MSPQLWNVMSCHIMSYGMAWIWTWATSTAMNGVSPVSSGLLLVAPGVCVCCGVLPTPTAAPAELRGFPLRGPSSGGCGQGRRNRTRTRKGKTAETGKKLERDGQVGPGLMLLHVHVHVHVVRRHLSCHPILLALGAFRCTSCAVLVMFCLHCVMS